jgi:hypothetical protein
MLRISNFNLVVLTSKFNYLHRRSNSDFFSASNATLFASDINSSTENSILIVGCNSRKYRLL